MYIVESSEIGWKNGSIIKVYVMERVSYLTIGRALFIAKELAKMFQIYLLEDLK